MMILPSGMMSIACCARDPGSPGSISSPGKIPSSLVVLAPPINSHSVSNVHSVIFWLEIQKSLSQPATQNMSLQITITRSTATKETDNTKKRINGDDFTNSIDVESKSSKNNDSVIRQDSHLMTPARARSTGAAEFQWIECCCVAGVESTQPYPVPNIQFQTPNIAQISCSREISPVLRKKNGSGCWYK